MSSSSFWNVTSSFMSSSSASGLRATDDIGHHARAFLQLHDCDRVGWGETGDRAVMNHVAVELTLPARLEYADFSRATGRAEWARGKIDVGAGIAALQAQLVYARALPEMPGLRCRFWSRARRLGHIVLPGTGHSTNYFSLDGQWRARRQRSSRGVAYGPFRHSHYCLEGNACAAATGRAIVGQKFKKTGRN